MTNEVTMAVTTADRWTQVPMNMYYGSAHSYLP
jgi:hypothetical protein